MPFARLGSRRRELIDDDPQPNQRANPPERVVSHDRLWTPWRMRYVTGGARESGCIFCNRRDSEDDVAALIVHRAQHAFVIMNLFPYNTGHVMIVPNMHVDTLEGLPRETLVEMAELAPKLTSALRRVLRCDGFNLGLNLGSIAGAGVADHLHQHVVPRWRGDANFMPILASTMVMPELIPATYAKVRAELERELLLVDHVRAAILSEDDEVIVLHGDVLPTGAAIDDEPLWRTALDMASAVGSDVEIVGWAGQHRSGGTNRSATLTVRARRIALRPGWSRVATSDIMERGPDELRQTVQRALGAAEKFHDAS